MIKFFRDIRQKLITENPYLNIFIMPQEKFKIGMMEISFYIPMNQNEKNKEIKLPKN